MFGFRTRHAANSATLMADFGGRPVEITLAVPGPFTPTHGRSPDVPPSERHCSGFFGLGVPPTPNVPGRSDPAGFP